MLFVSPTVEVGALYDRPVSFEPGPHQRVAADHLQVCNVLWPEKFVVLQLARNEDAILLDRLARPRILIRELSDFPSGRIGVDIARLDPLVSGPAGVACCPKPAGYTLARAQRCHQPQNRRGARERAQLLDIHPRVAVPLVSVRVRVALEISKAKSSSVRPAPHLVLIVVSRPDRHIDLPASLDRLEELHPLATDHQPDSVLSVKISMGGPFAEHPVRLAAAAGAAEENLEHRARQQGRLRPRLRLPPDRVLSGGFLAIRHQCFSFAPGAYSACHSSRVAETAGARMTVGRAISPECSTDERREWQKGAAALAISSRRPTGWLGSRMIRSMYASGSSPVAAASCRTCSFARLAAPLGRPAPGRFPPCPFIVLSRGRPKTAGRTFGIRFICTTIRYSSPSAAQYRFRYREGWLHLESRAAQIRAQL